MSIPLKCLDARCGDTSIHEIPKFGSRQGGPYVIGAADFIAQQARSGQT